MKDNKIVNIVGLLLVTALSFFIVFQIKDYVDAKANAIEGVSKDAVEEVMDVTGQDIVTSAVKYVNKEGVAEAFKVTTGTQGFQSTVELEIVFAEDGKTVKSVTVLSQGETEGFGSKIQDPEILAKFEGAVSPLDGLDLISGATITSDAAKKGVNKASEFIQVAEFGAVVEEEPTQGAVDPMAGISADATEEAMDVAGSDVKAAVKYVKDGTVEGYKVTVAPSGFGGPIEMELVFAADGLTVQGVYVLAHAETPGFGAKLEDAEIQAKFAGLLAPMESIDLIAGATITSEAVMAGINAASEFIQVTDFGATAEEKPTEAPAADPMEGITGEEEAMDVAGQEIVTSAVKYVKDGEVEAYKVTVAPNGFAGPIEMELVFEADGLTVKGVTILSQTETAGFGAKIEDAENLAKFVGVVSPVESFDLIAGATITSEAARFGIDTASAFIQSVEFGTTVEVREPDMVAGATE